MGRELRLSLNNQGMTSLHRAGLVGLYLTLESFEAEDLPDLTWDLGSETILLKFESEQPADAFKSLIKKSFSIDKHGFFKFPGLEAQKTLSTPQKYHLYDALKHTFLQFGPHCNSQAPQSITYEIEEKIYVKEFKPLISYKHQDAPKEFLDNKGNFKSQIPIKGWLYPGGVERHIGLSNTSLSEPPELALCLLYAPLGVLFYNLSSIKYGGKAKMAMVIPEVDNLEDCAEIRREFISETVTSLTASGSNDAALKYLLARTIKDSLFISNSGCTVICFGTVTWNEKQKTRTYITKISKNQKLNLKNYNLAHAIFENQPQAFTVEKNKKSKTEAEKRYFIRTSVMRELIAGNCAINQPWYLGFCELLSNKEIREKQLKYEGEKFFKMLEKSEMGEQERNYVLTCQEAWRRRMGQLGERAEKEKADFNTLVNREQERLRSAISKCRNASSLRQVMIDFWSRGSKNKVLENNWLEVAKMFNNVNWKKGRDLALLALVSYKRPEEQENKPTNLLTVNNNKQLN